MTELQHIIERALNRFAHPGQWIREGDCDHTDEATAVLEALTAAGFRLLSEGEVPPWMEELPLEPHPCTEAPGPCLWIRYRMR